MPQAVPTYEQAIEYLYGRINYERTRAKNLSESDFKLDRMKQLLALLGDPQEKLPAVHIAGTKGKGSTAAMIAGMFSAAEIRVGLFTSPHLFSFEERMTVDGVPPRKEEIVDLVNRVSEPATFMERRSGRFSPTFFEITTAMAWLHFLQREVDLAVLEVGLGGRLDATNLCRPDVTVITNISRDHTELLGKRLSQIAREKAGIVKPGVPLISGVIDGKPKRVIEDVCRQQQAPLLQLGKDIRYRHSAAAPSFDRSLQGAEKGDLRPAASGDPHTPQAPSHPQVMQGALIDVIAPHRLWRGIRVPILGEHQAANAALAVGVVDELCHQGRTVDPDAACRGLAEVRWPIRIEVLREQPTVVVDAAHNSASVAALVNTLNTTFPPRRRILVFGATRGKDVSGMLRHLVPEFDAVVVTRYMNNPRSVPVDALGKMVHALCEIPVHRAPDPAAAWRLARRLATDDDLICVTGSFFLAAEVRDLLTDADRHSVPSPELSPRPATPSPCD